MTKTALEIMARAIWAQRQITTLLWGVKLLDWDEETERQRMDVMDEARAALVSLKGYPPVFGDLGARKGSPDKLYREDRIRWNDCIDKLLSEKTNV